MNDPIGEQAAALADLIGGLLGPAPAGAGLADRRTRQAAARRNASRARPRAGCICEPNITYHAADPTWRGLQSVTAAHDDWCPMVGAGRSLDRVPRTRPAPASRRPQRAVPLRVRRQVQTVLRERRRPPGDNVMTEPDTYGLDCVALEECHDTFRRWLGDTYDLDALDVMIATAAAEQLGGDPLWLLVISGSGNAKTETVQSLDGAGALVVSTISGDAALLSGTPAKQRARTGPRVDCSASSAIGGSSWSRTSRPSCR